MIGAMTLYAELMPQSALLAHAGLTPPASPQVPPDDATASNPGQAEAVGHTRGFPDPLARLPRCPLRATTGVGCPSCGATRAVACLATGHLGAALRWNAVAVFGLLGAVFMGALACVHPRAVYRLSAAGGRGLRTVAGRALITVLLVAQSIWFTTRSF
jgi:hypothetical protein